MPNVMSLQIPEKAGITPSGAPEVEFYAVRLRIPLCENEQSLVPSKLPEPILPLATDSGEMRNFKSTASLSGNGARRAI